MNTLQTLPDDLFEKIILQDKLRIAELRHVCKRFYKYYMNISRKIPGNTLDLYNGYKNSSRFYIEYGWDGFLLVESCGIRTINKKYSPDVTIFSKGLQYKFSRFNPTAHLTLVRILNFPKM